jgi:hypothetical protein
MGDAQKSTGRPSDTGERVYTLVPKDSFCSVWAPKDRMPCVLPCRRPPRSLENRATQPSWKM